MLHPVQNPWPQALIYSSIHGSSYSWCYPLSGVRRSIRPFMHVCNHWTIHPLIPFTPLFVHPFMCWRSRAYIIECLYEIIRRVGLPCTAVFHGTLLPQLFVMSAMTYVFIHVIFHRQTEAWCGDQAICRARILMRRCSIILPVVWVLMGILVLVMDIRFMMVILFFFSLCCCDSSGSTL